MVCGRGKHASPVTSPIWEDPLSFPETDRRGPQLHTGTTVEAARSPRSTTTTINLNLRANHDLYRVILLLDLLKLDETHAHSKEANPVQTLHPALAIHGANMRRLQDQSRRQAGRVMTRSTSTTISSCRQEGEPPHQQIRRPAPTKGTSAPCWTTSTSPCKPCSNSPSNSHEGKSQTSPTEPALVSQL